MTVSEKLIKIAENEQKVFDAGKQAEYDRFWDALQQDGYLRGYHYMFFINRWNDKNYNPKYPIVANNIGYGFAHSSITNTLVDIDITMARTLTGHMFDNATRLKTIPKLIVSTENTFDYSFQNCNALENITIEGTIASSIDFQWSTKLTKESIKSIMTHLSLDDAPNESGFWGTVTLPLEAVDREFYFEGNEIDPPAIGSESADWMALLPPGVLWDVALI